MNAGQHLSWADVEVSYCICQHGESKTTLTCWLDFYPTMRQAPMTNNHLQDVENEAQPTLDLGLTYNSCYQTVW